MKLRIPYLGTPTFSAQVLDRILTNLSSEIEVPFVMTQPDMPVGRNKVLTESPVKTCAKKHKVKVFENFESLPKNLLQSCDAALTFAYGKIIDSAFLRAPKHGFLNIHPSLLPHFRGATPVSFPLLIGNQTTGTSLIKMDEKLDHGPIIAQKTHQISPTILHHELLTELSDISYYTVIETVEKIRSNTLNFAIQNENEATYTFTLSRDDGFIHEQTLVKLMRNDVLASNDYPAVLKKYIDRNPASRINVVTGMHFLWNMYRALHPWPGIWTEIQVRSIKKRMKITEMDYNNGSPVIAMVQLEGKNPVAFKQFQDAYQILI